MKKWKKKLKWSELISFGKNFKTLKAKFYKKDLGKNFERLMRLLSIHDCFLQGN